MTETRSASEAVPKGGVPSPDYSSPAVDAAKVAWAKLILSDIPKGSISYRYGKGVKRKLPPPHRSDKVTDPFEYTTEYMVLSVLHWSGEFQGDFSTHSNDPENVVFIGFHMRDELMDPKFPEANAEFIAKLNEIVGYEEAVS